MGVKVPTTCLHCSQPSVPHYPSASQTLASSISFASSKRRSISDCSLVCQFVHRSALFGTQSTKLSRTRSCDRRPKPRFDIMRRAFSASLDAFSEEEFSKEIHELAMKFQCTDDEEAEYSGNSEIFADSFDPGIKDTSENFVENQRIFPDCSKLEPVEPPDWVGRDAIIPASIERKANSVDLPLSLRNMKRKKQWQQGFKEAGDSAYCSVKAAFSSMVFIIRELHSFTLQMREVLFYEDLQGVLVRVKREIHASFVWLFQQVFSHTPTLMVYVMILLANYSVHSMASNAAFAAFAPPQAYAATVQPVSGLENPCHPMHKFDSSAIKTFSPSSSSSGKTTSIGGISGGGGNYRPIASGTHGDGSSENHQTIVPDGFSTSTRTGEEESVSGQDMREDELILWNSIVEEASKMQDSVRDESLDHETMLRLVSPVNAEIEEDDQADYLKTELLYQTGLAQDPNNPLLLANYAQFLYLVFHDYDRAEEYFKRAVTAEPKDAEALSKYANFLWKVRKDLWMAEETYLEAIAVDPSNSHYAANYAHFLWNTGGDDTCFPLASPDINEA